MKSCFTVFVLGLLVCLYSNPVMGHTSVGISANQSTIRFETNRFLLEVSTAGTVRGMTDKRNNRAVHAKGASVKFMKLQTDAAAYDLTRLSIDKDILTAEFSGADFTAKFKVSITSALIAIELISVSSDQFEYLEFVRLPVGIAKTLATLMNAAYDNRYAVAVMAGTPETNADVLEYLSGGRGPVLGARCWSAVSISHIKAVVLGCAKEALMHQVKGFEFSHGLPHPTIDGQWVKQSDDLLEGYLFCDLSKDNLDAAISYALQGGFGHILILSSSWSASYGHYPINTKYFPGGMADLKDAVDRIHASGLKAGLHFLAAGISAGDRYISPVPDPRLHKKRQFRLAKSVDPKSTVLLAEPVTTRFAPAGKQQNLRSITLNIGNELLGCTHAISHPGAYHCRRGAFGTQPEFHAIGETAFRLTRKYHMFLPAPDTTLVDEIAGRVAHVYNTCGFDMVYVDGGEAMMAVGPGWYTMGLLHRAFFEKIEGDVLWQGSGTPHFSWHYLARLTCRDAVHIGAKAYSDQRKTPLIKNYYQPNLITPDIGWWGYYAHSPSVPGTLPDEIEYMCAKAVGWDAAISLLCKLDALASNGRTAEALSRLKLWQVARRTNAFPAHIKRQLKATQQDFRLIHDASAGFAIKPVTHLDDRIVDPHDTASTSWTIRNHASSHTISFRLRALTGLAPHGSKANIILYDPAVGSGFGHAVTRNGSIKAKTEIHPNGGKAGQAVLRLSAETPRQSHEGYVGWTRTFSTPLDLSAHRIPGIWIQGPGKSGVLNIQLEDAAGKFRDHYLDLGFQGWRYVVLHQPETRRVWEFKWKYNKEYCLRDFNYSRVKKISLYLNGLKPSVDTTVVIGRIEALHEHAATLRYPTLSINQQTMTLPVEMQADDYLECDEQGKCRQFNASGWQTGTISGVVGDNRSLNSIKPGENHMVFSASGNARARLSICLNGPVLQ